jgi:multicomponent Na+:H+ antiporter subunit B
MISLILRTATKYLMPLLLMFSLFLLLRGHNEPGGGFDAGLVAAAAFALYALASGVPAARRALQVDVHVFIGVGLLLALVAGLYPLLLGEPFLTGIWTRDLVLPRIGKIDLGTPLLFDVGVFLVVLGVALLIVFSLAEE